MSRRARRSPRRSGGMSLVELMVAITIGAILLGGAITLFVNNRDTYNVTNDLARLQETARFALGMMLKDIRMAGYFGCSIDGGTRVANLSTNDPTELRNPTHAIEGLDADDGSFQPSGLTPTVGNNGAAGEILAGRDAITVRYLAGSMSNDLAVSNADAAQVTIGSATGFVPDNIVGIFDCGSADIFHVDTVSATQLTPLFGLSRSYEQSPTSTPRVAPFVGVRYYIGHNGRGPALYRATVAADGVTETYTEMFEGVEYMHLLYGVDGDADGAPDQYQKADGVANWNNVVSVRIGLLIRTVDEYGRDTDTKTYKVNDEVAVNPPDDRRRRRVFVTTAMLRN